MVMVIFSCMLSRGYFSPHAPGTGVCGCRFSLQRIQGNIGMILSFLYVSIAIRSILTSTNSTFCGRNVEGGRQMWKESAENVEFVSVSGTDS